MKKFIKNISGEILSERNLILYIEINKNLKKKNILQKLLQNIFSVRNSENTTHKIITFLGLKVKIKRDK